MGYEETGKSVLSSPGPLRCLIQTSIRACRASTNMSGHIPKNPSIQLISTLGPKVYE